MWDITRRIKGLPESPSTKMANDMIRREWEGETISYEEYEDFKDLLMQEAFEEDEQDCPAALDDLEANRKEILKLLHKFKLSFENYFRLCQSLCELAKNSPPSDELLRVYCYLLCDGGHILETGFQNSEDQKDWVTVMDDAETLFVYLQERRKNAQRFRTVLQQIKKIRPTNHNPLQEAINIGQIRAIFEAYTQVFVEYRTPELIHNLSDFMQSISTEPSLMIMKPLVFYQILVCHGKRLRTCKIPEIDYRKLWKYKRYLIDEDNGKNFKQNTRYLTLFEQLYDIFRSDPQVDLPLCLYGFDRLSNLGKFYRNYPPKMQILPFDIPIEEIVLDSRFSYLEDGYTENSICEEANVKDYFIQIGYTLCSEKEPFSNN